MNRLHTSFVVLLVLGAGNGFASEEEEPNRPLRPTAAELEKYELPKPADTSGPTGSASSLFVASGVGLFAASAADIGTTEWGIARGLDEANPFASQRGIRLVHHVVGPAAVYWTTEHLRRNGKPGLALGLRIALMAAYSYAAVHNLHQVSSSPASR